MPQKYILSVMGADRPGLVDLLADAIARHPGNWLDARLMRLEGTFAGLVLVALPDDERVGLERALRTLAREGLEVTLAVPGEAPPDRAGRRWVLDIVGPDRPGIVREVAGALARAGLNVLELESQVRPAPMSSESLFEAHVIVAAPDTADRRSLQATLDGIAEAMTLDIQFVDD